MGIGENVGCNVGENTGSSGLPIYAVPASDATYFVDPAVGDNTYDGTSKTVDGGNV